MLELLTIFALILLNAVLSGAEMAVVSSRRARLQAAADRGSRRARAALRLRNDPERFLATVQIFITLGGAIAGVYGGSTLIAVLYPLPEGRFAHAASPSATTRSSRLTDSSSMVTSFVA